MNEIAVRQSGSVVVPESVRQVARKASLKIHSKRFAGLCGAS